MDELKSGTVSANAGQSRTRLALVSVWSTQQGIVLGQMKANGTGDSEVTAAKELLDLINIEGVTVVGDHDYDMQAAKNVCAKAVRASWHAYIPPQSCQWADFHFRRVEDFHDWSQSISRLPSPEWPDIQAFERIYRGRSCLRNFLNF